MADYNLLTSRCHFLPALRKLFSGKQLQRALASTGKKFRSRVISAEVVLMAMVAGFIQGSLGLEAVIDWLTFGTAVGKCSFQALYQMRARLGWRPLRWLRRHCVSWLGCAKTDASPFFHGHRVLIADGTTFTTADTLENRRAFGKSKNQYKESGFPLVRLAALCEMGTRAVVHWVARKFSVSEQALLQKLIRFIPKNALLLGDRNFHNCKLWKSAQDAGFFLLLRLKSGPKFPVQTMLPDGSYLSRIVPRRGKKRSSGRSSFASWKGLCEWATKQLTCVWSPICLIRKCIRLWNCWRYMASVGKLNSRFERSSTNSADVIPSCVRKLRWA
jgi:hypothetical protein